MIGTRTQILDFVLLNTKEYFMKNLGLVSLVFAGVTFAIVGCTSTQSPESAQTTQSPDATAPSASTDQSIQSSPAAQSDSSIQQAPVQASPLDVPESSQAPAQ